MALHVIFAYLKDTVGSNTILMLKNKKKYMWKHSKTLMK